MSKKRRKHNQVHYVLLVPLSLGYGVKYTLQVKCYSKTHAQVTLHEFRQHSFNGNVTTYSIQDLPMYDAAANDFDIAAIVENHVQDNVEYMTLRKLIKAWENGAQDAE